MQIQREIAAPDEFSSIGYFISVKFAKRPPSFDRDTEK
jgi:hypothetical protein